MDVTIKKIGQRDGEDRFILLDPATRQILTVDDVSERALRRFFRKHGASDALIDEALLTARRRYAKRNTERQEANVDQAAETIDDTDLLFELGLEDDANG